MAGAERFEVTVVYALPQRQEIVRLRVSPGTTVLEAVRQSGIARAFPELDLAHVRMGIYSRLIDGRREVRPGDRIEVYRPLQVDPKQVRRIRAAATSQRNG